MRDNRQQAISVGVSGSTAGEKVAYTHASL